MTQVTVYVNICTSIYIGAYHTRTISYKWHPMPWGSNKCLTLRALLKNYSDPSENYGNPRKINSDPIQEPQQHNSEDAETAAETRSELQAACRTYSAFSSSTYTPYAQSQSTSTGRVPEFYC
jgi:hypothetical protein